MCARVRRERYVCLRSPDDVEEMFNARVAGVKNDNVRRFMAQAFAPSRDCDPAVLDLNRLLLK